MIISKPGRCPVKSRRAIAVSRLFVVDRRVLLRLPYRLLARTFEPLLSAQVAPVLEHIARVRVKCPVAALARPVGGPRHFDEAVVERQTVSDGVLPALLVLAVVREEIHD